jgi:hypothetical protein
VYTRRSEVTTNIMGKKRPKTLMADDHEQVHTSLGADMERVADILERNVFVTLDDWLDRIESDAELAQVNLSKQDRLGNLAKLIWDLSYRLRVPRKLGIEPVSDAAVELGRLRYSQGYSISMVVEESRILRICIFETLYRRLSAHHFRSVLSNAKTITDECDSQLKQTLASFARQTAIAA